jgi:hypothetical protein
MLETCAGASLKSYILGGASDTKRAWNVSLRNSRLVCGCDEPHLSFLAGSRTKCGDNCVDSVLLESVDNRLSTAIVNSDHARAEFPRFGLAGLQYEDK